jgi:transaldolase
MLTNRPTTKILLDGGDSDETRGVRDTLGFLDGQTTNPTFVAKNPDVQRRIASGKQEYKKIVQKISPLVGSAGVSIEVFADLNTSADKCWRKVRRCFPGFRMHMSTTRAFVKACGPQNCQSKETCA